MIKNLQTLRILFTLLVVTAHLNAIWRVLGVEEIADALAHVSVDGFVVSAFLILYTHALRPRSPLEFLGRRMARLVPFYWFITYAVAALAVLAPSLFQSTVVTTDTLLKSLFFIPYEKTPGVVEPIVFVGWTMNLFVGFMVLHALSLKVFKEKAWLSTTIVLCLLIVAGWVFKPADVALEFFTMPRLWSFVVGVLLAQWWISARDRIAPESMPHWAPRALAAAGVAALALTTLRDIVFAGISPRFIGPLLGAIVVVSVIMLDKLGFQHHSKLRDTIADASFAIYLTHYFVTQAAVKIVQRFEITSLWIIVPLLAGTYLGVIVLGVLAQRLVETPLEAISRSAFQRRRGSDLRSTALERRHA